MGHKGILRLFPVWPKDRNASFRNIRCRGAFLVSSELKDGTVQYVHIKSERGKPCIVENPWPGNEVLVSRDGIKTDAFSGNRFTLYTKTDETIRLTPVE